MQSVWTDSIKEIRNKPSAPLSEDVKTDVLIIGGGLAGILCAYKLKEAGVPNILVEAKQIGSGITGNTTGKVTAQHGIIYNELIKSKGMEKARQYYEANNHAVNCFRELSQDIDCDFEEKTAYVYATNNRKMLEDEADAYQALNIPMHFKEDPPLPIHTMGALGMENQAQFNPLKLIMYLAKDLKIYENTFVNKINGNYAFTEQGRVTADHIILATHFPLVNIPGMYFMKMYQHRSYVIALKNGADMQGMYLDGGNQNGKSFRNYQDMLLVGGGDHRTGKKGGGFKELRKITQNAYPNSQEKFAWATQDCMSLDKIPYIGVHRNSAQNLYTATGFNKWGMSGSMLAANLLTEIITAGKSDYEELFAPSRSMLNAQLFSNLIHSAAGLLSFRKPRCAHMGCALKWNAAEHSWDCSCHGSRFDKSGNLINNPSKRGIKIE